MYGIRVEVISAVYSTRMKVILVVYGIRVRILFDAYGIHAQMCACNQVALTLLPTPPPLQG